jgi:cytochrome c oxidase assembly protein Cox11
VFLPCLSSFFVPYVASFSEMSVFIAPLLVFANVYLYNYICRLSTYQESNRWSADFHEYKDNNVKVRSIRLYYGRMATINLNFSEYYLAFWNVQNMWDKIYWNTNILTFLIDRKFPTETSNVVSCNNDVGPKLCLVYFLYKYIWCELKSIWTTVWFYNVINIIVLSKYPLYNWSGIS